MKIPITLCHGITWQPKQKKEQPYTRRLTKERFENYFQVASEMGFESISYNDLNFWRTVTKDPPEKPIMFDFDHPDWSIGREIEPIMSRFGYQSNLFINTSPMENFDNPFTDLTSRELEVLKLIANGFSNKEITNQLVNSRIQLKVISATS